MVIFHSYVGLPEGKDHWETTFWPKPPTNPGLESEPNALLIMIIWFALPTPLTSICGFGDYIKGYIIWNWKISWKPLTCLFTFHHFTSIGQLDIHLRQKLAHQQREESSWLVHTTSAPTTGREGCTNPRVTNQTFWRLCQIKNPTGKIAAHDFPNRPNL